MADEKPKLYAQWFNPMLVGMAQGIQYREATDAQIEAAGFVRASRLAAAEAMAEHAKRFIYDVAIDCPDAGWRNLATRTLDTLRGILASRPSEQASREGSGQCKVCGRPRGGASGYCDGGVGPIGDAECYRIGYLRLETQLAEAKASLVHQENYERAERWANKESAAAPTEEPKSQPHPQGARLGGPADKLRADIAVALRDLATMADADTAPRHIAWQKLANELERLGKNT